MWKKIRWICLLNDDAEPLTRDWLKILIEEGEDRPDVWFVGCSGNCRSAPHNTGKLGDRRPPKIVAHNPGFCLVMRRVALDHYEGLNEELVHYGSEVDLQWRAAGDFSAQALWVPGVFCDHPRKRAIEPWWTEDQKVFKQLWRL